MLKKSHISNIEIYTEAWHTNRLGRFTSSKIFSLCAESIDNKAAMTYIYQKVGESLTGVSNDKELDFDEDLEWGKLYEPDAIRAFGKAIGQQFLVTQTLICDQSTKFASTPDCILVHGECKLDATEYNVSTAEGKCPRTYHNFIPYFLCKTPQDLYQLSKRYFWQTVDQMHQAGASKGYFFVYHPYFPPECNLNIIEFRQMELWKEFKLLADRKKQAIQLFSEIREKMMNKLPHTKMQ
jgi:hypothetical protein